METKTVTATVSPTFRNTLRIPIRPHPTPSCTLPDPGASTRKIHESVHESTQQIRARTPSTRLFFNTSAPASLRSQCLDRSATDQNHNPLVISLFPVQN